MDGFLNIDKPAGWTSHDVVARLRHVLGTDLKSLPSRFKVGHTGTLDPAATGVLPVCLGKATKLAGFLAEADKEYRAVMRLGETTDTQDAAGKVLIRRPVGVLTENGVQEALLPFIGEIQQIPPMYSAVKVGGQPLYKAARAGLEVARAPRTVVIRRLTLVGLEGNDVALEVACSKGTYIRTLCADIGERLGTGAHLHRLVRTRSGPFRIETAITLPDLEAALREGRIGDWLLPVGEIFQDFPIVRVTPNGARQLLHGAPIGLPKVERMPKEFKTGQSVLVYNASGDLIALAEALVGCREAPTVGRGNVFKVQKLLV